MSRRPLAIDLCCGLGGWTKGLLAAGYDVIGYDIEEHIYGEDRYPAWLILKDIRDMHGAEISDADLIVASPPCQEFSYMAMPWSRAKAKAAAIRADETGEARRKLTELFDTCFRLQEEASAAKGKRIPMLVENVRGANPWIGKAPYHFGSFYLWGDIPSVMPKPNKSAVKVGGGMGWYPPDDPRRKPGQGFNTLADRNLREENGRKVPGFRFDGSGGSFQTASVKEGLKHGGDWFSDPSSLSRQGGQVKEGVKFPGKTRDPSRPQAVDGWFNDPDSPNRLASNSSARKAASARIAEIPFVLSEWVGLLFLFNS